jgi:hypothetical protein
MSSSRGVHCEIDKMEIIDEHKDGSYSFSNLVSVGYITI